METEVDCRPGLRLTSSNVLNPQPLYLLSCSVYPAPSCLPVNLEVIPLIMRIDKNSSDVEGRFIGKLIVDLQLISSIISNDLRWSFKI